MDNSECTCLKVCILTFSSSAVKALAPILLSAMTTPRHSFSAIRGNVSMHFVWYPVCLSTKSQNFLLCIERRKDNFRSCLVESKGGSLKKQKQQKKTLTYNTFTLFQICFHVPINCLPDWKIHIYTVFNVDFCQIQGSMLSTTMCFVCLFCCNQYSITGSTLGVRWVII